MLTRMDGKVALVTGGGAGIGAATCKAFAEMGARVMVADISVEAGEASAAALRAAGHEAGFVKVDVSKEADVAAMVEATIRSFGRLDFAHNNAGIDQFERLTVVDISEQYWDRIVSVNLKGVFLGLKYEIPAMLKNGGGAIVNTSSGAGLKGVANLAAYVSSKFGIIGLTKTTAIDFATQNIRVNAICPGPILTSFAATIAEADPALSDIYRRMNPMERFGRPEEIANAVVWLCSAQASYATGMIMAVDGGFSAN
jgi:NAD(P)-dependent dehydrogenase (short-subunit alcohol dehydrogenase family)